MQTNNKKATIFSIFFSREILVSIKLNSGYASKMTSTKRRSASTHFVDMCYAISIGAPCCVIRIYSSLFVILSLVN